MRNDLRRMLMEIRIHRTRIKTVGVPENGELQEKLNVCGNATLISFARSRPYDQDIVSITEFAHVVSLVRTMRERLSEV